MADTKNIDLRSEEQKAKAKARKRRTARRPSRGRTEAAARTKAQKARARVSRKSGQLTYEQIKKLEKIEELEKGYPVTEPGVHKATRGRRPPRTS